MKRPQPMNRLLQGDVGSGKTIVALMAALVAMENGFQVAFMAPTEILAEQHFINIRRLLETSRFRMALLTGTTPAKKRREMQAELVGRLVSPGRRHARAHRGPGGVPRAGAGHHRRAAPLRRDAARRAAGQGHAPRHPGDDRDADSAHAGADDLRRPRRLGDARDAAGPQADQDDRQAGVAARRDLRLHPRAARRRPAGLRHLPAGRGVGEGRSEGGDRDGRSPAAGRLPGLPRRRCCTGA